MSDSLGKLTASLGLDSSSLAAGVAGAKEALGSLGGPVGGAVVLVAGLGAAVFAVGEKFQGAYNKIQVGTGATGAALKGLDASFKDVLAGTAGSFDQVAAAITGISQRTGLTGAALDDFAKKEVTLGRITKTDVGENVQATTALFNLYGVAAENQSGKLDVLFRASQVAGVSIGELTSQVSAATPVAKALGLTFDQTAALTANLTAAGLPASKVMQGLGKEFTAAAKAGKDPLSVISDIEEQIKKAPNDTAAAEIAFQKFGVRAGPQLAAALREGRFDLTQTLATIDSGKGGILETGAAVSTLGGKFQRLKNEVLVAMEPAGAALVRFANEGMGKVVAYVPTLIAGITQIVGYIRDNFVPVFLDVGSVLAKIAGFVSDNFIPVAAAVGAVVAFVVVPAFISWAAATAAAAVATVVAAAPIIALTAAVGAVAFAVVYAYEHFQIFHDVVDGVASFLVTTVETAFHDIEAVVRDVIDLISSYIQLGLDLIRGNWGDAWADVKDILSSAMSLIGDLVHAGLDAVNAEFAGLPGQILDALGDLGDLLYNAGVQIIQGLWQGIVDKFEDVKHFVGGIGSWIADHKGPLEKDRALLVPHGGAIMEGLRRGIATGRAGLERDLADITGMVAGVRPGASAASGRAGTSGGPGAGAVGGITIHVHPSAGMDEQALGAAVAREMAWAATR